MSPRPPKRPARSSAAKRGSAAKRSAKASRGSGPARHPQRTMPPVPRAWNTMSANGDAAMRALATGVRDAVSVAADADAVVRALIGFHAAWAETGHGDSAVQENVHAWMAALAEASGLDADATLERVAARAIDLAPAPIERWAQEAAALLQCDLAAVQRRLDSLVAEVGRQLQGSTQGSTQEVAIPGLGVFSRASQPTISPRLRRAVAASQPPARWTTLRFRPGLALKSWVNARIAEPPGQDQAAASPCVAAWWVENRMAPAEGTASLAALARALATVLARSRAVACAGLGTFIARTLSARTGMNPKTLEPVVIPASIAVGFLPEERWHQRSHVADVGRA